ncbi:ABC transporter permease [Anditalea andensis]|uniref:Transporter permease n=1 Tax=Anditalea andensis TaxID=1048983 RepID=A0A074KQQ3_9BACT|nr:ABC transporter permease [Anditalea andensis]KEO72276.1 hypothetical protein EL17_16115 [Anditalea andensis]
MLHHNIILIFRNFKRFKSSFFINLIGLSTGLACSLLIFLWVMDELRMDRFHDKQSQIYQVMENHRLGADINTIPNTAGLLAESMAEDFPEVVYAATVAPAKWFGDFNLKVEGADHVKSKGQFVGKDFLKIFSYPLVEGDKDQVLDDKYAIVITESLAEKLFNTSEGLVGKSLEVNLMQYAHAVTITGVMRDLPRHSSERFDFLVNFEAFKEINPSVVHWGNSGPHAYLLLEEGTDEQAFNSKIENYLHTKSDETGFRSLFATPNADVYLYGLYENGKQAGGRISYVKLFSLIAVFILLIACINFMNLSTAKASRRVKEVGIKKAIGANKSVLVFQYLGESLSMAFISLLVALLLVVLALPQFNVVTGKALSLGLDASMVVMVVLITLITGLLAGSYPAFYLSGFNLVSILKGNMKSSFRELLARKGLVAFQFALSVVMIVSVIVVYLQIEYVQNKNLGFDKENVLTFPVEGKVALNTITFLSELERIPGIIHAGSMQQRMIGNANRTVGVHWDGKNPEETIEFANFTVSPGIIEVFGIPVVAGRTLSAEVASDSSALVLNEKAVAIMGLEEPVGASVNLWGQDRTVIGVVQDYHFESMQETVKPSFFKLDDWGNGMQKAAVKIQSGREKETLAALQSFYKSYNPGYEFAYTFIDAEYQALYEAEERVGVLSKYFAGLAILISCLGLFGLSAFSAERRTKEIGIRKTLGASELGIAWLLTSEFTKLVLMALIIGLPISYFIVAYWLGQYAYKINLEWWYFCGAGMITLLVAMITVSFQSSKAAMMNPVKSLRNE